MAKCTRIARRTGRTCRNDAHPPLEAAGVLVCEIHGRAEGLLNEDGAPAAAPPTPLRPSTTPPRPPVDAPAPVDRGVLALPPAPALDAEPTTAPPVAGPADLAGLDAAAGELWGELPADPGAADAAAEAATATEPTPDPSGYDVSDWTAERVEFYVRMLLDPTFKRTGKEPLQEHEAREGAKIGAVVISQALNGAELTPTQQLLAWAAVVVGTRYAGEILALVGRVPALSRLRDRARPAPVSDVADMEAVPVQAAHGWAAEGAD